MPENVRIMEFQIWRSHEDQVLRRQVRKGELRERGPPRILLPSWFAQHHTWSVSASSGPLAMANTGPEAQPLDAQVRAYFSSQRYSGHSLT